MTHETADGHIIQIIRVNTSLEEDKVLEKAHERAPQFKDIPGLIQKYYVRLGAPNQFAGIYIWDSKTSLLAFRESELAASIPAAYQMQGPPDIELLEVLFQLRD